MRLASATMKIENVEVQTPIRDITKTPAKFAKRAVRSRANGRYNRQREGLKCVVVKLPLRNLPVTGRWHELYKVGGVSGTEKHRGG